MFIFAHITLNIENMEAWEYLTEDKNNECCFCGEDCEDRFCNKECERAYIADNTDRGDD